MIPRLQKDEKRKEIFVNVAKWSEKGVAVDIDKLIENQKALGGESSGVAFATPVCRRSYQDSHLS